MSTRLSGIPASAGVAIGPAQRYAPAAVKIAPQPTADPQAESRRLMEAIAEADRQLRALQAATAQRAGQQPAAIFAAQQTMLHDPELLEAIRQKIAGESLSAAAAVDRAVETYTQLLLQSDNDYLRERANDLRDVRGRILRNLLPGQSKTATRLDHPAIIVADDLTPSDTVQLDPQFVLGFCLAQGGTTSHTAILARSLGIPAVVGVGRLNVMDGEIIALDGGRGEVVLAPDALTLADFQQRKEHHTAQQAAVLQEAGLPPVTRDGRHIEVAANVNRMEDVEKAVEYGAEGIGLLRTEFLHMDRPPDEETQHRVYRQIAERLHPRPVTLRALDIGGDKPLPYLPLPDEANPFLGYRAIRLLLDHPDLFGTQLRAVLRANAGLDNIRLMLPMVTTVGEVHAARRLLDEARRTVRGADIALGIMVETPAAALMAEHFAPHVEFFSIGSNDLTQYTLAVDRGSPQVGYLYDALHPAVLKLIKHVIDAAHDGGRWVGICGELAGDAAATAILVGLGIDELSMSPPVIPAVKQIIRSLDSAIAQAASARALAQPDAEAVRALCS